MDEKSILGASISGIALFIVLKSINQQKLEIKRRIYTGIVGLILLLTGLFLMFQE